MSKKKVKPPVKTVKYPTKTHLGKTIRKLNKRIGVKSGRVK